MKDINLIDQYSLVDQFIYRRCGYQSNYCDGKHIPDLDSKGIDCCKVKDKPPCEYFREGKCHHKSHPRWTKRQQVRR